MNSMEKREIITKAFKNTKYYWVLKSEVMELIESCMEKYAMKQSQKSLNN